MRAMTRNRSETAAPVVQAARVTATVAQRTISAPDVHATDNSNGAVLSKDNQLPTIRFSPHQDTRSNRPSLAFASVSRTLPSPASIIRVGRYSERDSTSGYINEPNPGVPSQAPVGFKSKVVSRRHCEFWCQNGQWYIKDVGSSSGTFLNHIRLSQPGVESKPYVVNDGDVVQLGIDFRGGEEMIFRCVKIRVECNRGWQKGLNNFKCVHAFVDLAGFR
jgi:E3 ubiquitin-protein ligase DMA1/2